MKKVLSLALTLALCLGLTVPAFAAPLKQATAEDILKNFTITRNGTVDEKTDTFHADHTATMLSPYDETKFEVSYALISKEDSWTITHTGKTDFSVSGNTDYDICIYYCVYYADTETGNANSGVFMSGMPSDRWGDKGQFIPGFLESGGELGETVTLKPGQSTTIPASAFLNEGDPGAGNGPIYCLEVSSFYRGDIDPTEYPSDYKDLRNTMFYFRLDESGTAKIKASLNQPSQPEQPTDPQPSIKTANPSNDKLTVNGVEGTPTIYNIDNSNYFKIRDVAALLNGTEKQFSVGYDGEKQSVTATTGQSYEKLPTDLAGAPAGAGEAKASGDAIYVNGTKITPEVYNINGNNYFKLRDLGQALDFYIGWTLERGVYIETDKPYVG